MRLSSLILCLLLGMNTACLQAASPQAERIDFYYGIAEGNYLIGDLRGAERGIEQMLRIDPDHLPALTLKARVKLDQKEPEAALDATERAILLAPDKLEYRLLKALVLGNQGEQKKATDIINQVIRQADPGSDDLKAAQQLLGLLRMAEGEWDQAAEAFNQIYYADPASANTSLRLASEAYLEKARSKMQAGASDEAIAAVDQAIAVYKDSTGQESLQRRTALRLLRARLLTQIGQYASAIQDLQILTGQQPENFEALITLASLYASVDRWESLEALIPNIEARPELKDIALYLEGRAALAKDRVGTARAKFEAAIDLLPKEANALRRNLYFYRGLCLQKLERPEEAQREILNAIDAGFVPETSAEAILASQSLLTADRAADAIPILEAITLNRIQPSAEVWALLGRAHLAENNVPLALSALNESLAIEPDQPATRALRGSQLRKLGDLVGALSDYEAARALQPENASLLYACGLVYLQLGQISDAEQALGEASHALNQPGLFLLHALLAYTQEELDTARSALRAYQQRVPDDRNDAAIHLAYLLLDAPYPTQGIMARYVSGEIDRKAALDDAGKAHTPEQARQQICARAFWMAQHAKQQAQPAAAAELLQIAIDTGDSDLTEYQLAKWQLRRNARATNKP